jgi:hypothetical protein
MASSVVPFLIWLLCVGISAILIGYAIQENGLESLIKKEGFATSITMTSCPSSTEQYINKDGDTLCCDASIVNNKCNGTDVCTLSPTLSNGIKTCSEWANSHWLERANRFCPKSMPNYFGPIQRVPGSNEGCSVSQTSLDGSGPQDRSKPQCKIYATESDEYSKGDSCLNKKQLDAMTAPGTKTVMVTKGSQPALLVASAVPSDGSSVVPVSCYDFNRMKRYLQVVNPDLAARYGSDPCKALPNVVTCGIKCKNINKADLPSTLTPKANTVIGKISVTQNFSLSFDFTPLSIKNNWASLLHFTTGNDCCDLGHRAPGIWFSPNTIQTFAIHVGHSTDGSWACRPQSDSIQLNTKTSFKLVCSGPNITVSIGNSNFSYSHGGTRYAGPVTVFGGDPWYPAADVYIENIAYISL